MTGTAATGALPEQELPPHLASDPVETTLEQPDAAVTAETVAKAQAMRSGTDPSQQPEPEPDPEGPAQATLRIPDFTATVGEATVYDTFLDCQQGSSPDCTGEVGFTGAAGNLPSAETWTWEQENLLGEGGWENVPLDHALADGVRGTYGPFPIVAPLEGHTRCRLTLDDSVTPGAYFGRSTIYDAEHAALTQTAYAITVQASEGNGEDDVPDGTVSQVMAWVGGDRARAQRALDAELADQNRSTLVTQLEAIASA